MWLEDAERFARYLRRDEIHTAFNFDFMARPWRAKELRESIDGTLEAHRGVGAPPTWVLSNHDVTRPVTRYGRDDSAFAFAAKRFGTPTDLALGRRRARAAALLTAALPGCLYVYQGDELGLPEVEDLPLAAIQDPMHERSGGVDPGRDGCRVPLPWSGDRPPFGFSPVPGAVPDAVPGAVPDAVPGAVPDVEPWLPQPADWAGLTAERQAVDPASTLSLYRQVLALRRRLDHDAPLRWLDAPPEVLAFARGSLACVVNLGPDPVVLPEHRAVLLSSGALADGLLHPDDAVWLALPDGSRAPGVDRPDPTDPPNDELPNIPAPKE